MRAFVWAMVAAVASDGGVSPQTQPILTGVIAGVVTLSESKSPVSGAIVSITGPLEPGQSTSVLTGSDGRFAFGGLRPGTFTISAMKNGMTRGKGLSGKPIQLHAGQRITDLPISLGILGSLSGTVVDDLGDPVIGCTVIALRRQVRQSRMVWVNAGASTTDDLGGYRISGLLPADYAVGVVQSTNASVPEELMEAFKTDRQDTKTPGPNPQLIVQMGGVPGAGGGNPTARAIDGQIQFLPSSTLLPRLDSRGHRLSFPVTYYPSASDVADARAIRVEPSQQRSGVDFALRPRRVATVSGRVASESGPISLAGISLAPRNGAEIFPRNSALHSTITGPNGAFRFLDVIEGDYIVRVSVVPNPTADSQTMQTERLQKADGSTMVFGVRSPTSYKPKYSSEPTLFAEIPISVGSDDLSNLEVWVTAAPSLKGKVVFDGATPAPIAKVIEGITVSISSEQSGGLMGGFPRTTVDAAGSISSQGFPPGLYSLRVSTPPGWFVGSISAAGRNVADRGLIVSTSDIEDLVVTFIDRPTELKGSVTNESATVLVDSSVVVFPAEHRAGTAEIASSRTRVVPTDATGAYSILNLPPGDYFIAATDVDAQSVLSPEFLTALVPRSKRVSLVRGQKRILDLQLQGPR